MSFTNQSKQQTQQESDKAGTYPLEHVPLAARKSFFSVASILIGFTFFSPTIVAGAQVGSAFPFAQLMIILVLGNLILGIYSACMSGIGAQTGLGAVLLSKYTLGKYGVKWADLLLGGTEMGWYAVNANFIGTLYATAFDKPDMVVFWTIFWAVVMGITAIWGFKAVSLIAYGSLPMIVILVGLVPILALNKVGSLQALLAIQPLSSMSFATAITVIIGTFAAGGTQCNNWSKFCKNGKQGFWAGFVAFFVGNALMVFVGMVAAVAFQESDIAVIFRSMGIMGLAVLILTFNLWSSQNAGASAVGFAGSELFGKPKYRLYIGVGIVISTIAAISGVYQYFVPFLVILGTVIPPLGGTIIGDFLFTWKKKLPRLEYVEFKAFRVAPIAAYLVGTAVAVITSQMNIGLPPLQGIVAAAVCVPIANAVVKACGIDDMHKIKENAEYTE